jgi:hypothetical protein
MDARRSAEAVRQVLDRATEALRHVAAKGETALLGQAGGEQPQVRTGT